VCADDDSVPRRLAVAGFHALGNWYNWKRTEKTHTLQKIKMLIAMNRFNVIKEERKNFEDLWVTRQSHVEQLKSQSDNATLAYGRRYHDGPRGRVGAAGREEAHVPFSTSSPPPFMPGYHSSLARRPRSSSSATTIAIRNFSPSTRYSASAASCAYRKARLKRRG
jgi:hypothetical protein